MGVSGLLPVLKPIQEATTLERYRGKTLAVDTYAWLHKASFCCAEDLVLERPTNAYISYFKKKIGMLKHFQITPYFVFDGDFLPSKAGTEKEREKRRNEYKQLAIEAKKNGNVKLAFNYYQKACDISPEMAKSLINELKLQSINYIVAPYEADSQMVFLEKIGLVDGIISEDSDLLIFGSQVLITKLNDTANCIEIRRDNFRNCKGSHINSFNDDQLLLMATISGCDYTKGIPGIGIQKAIQLTKQYKTIDRVLMSIRVEGKSVPTGFEDEFKRAKIAFRHQIVFNPTSNQPQHLNPLTEEVESAFSREFIQSCTGFILDTEIHKKIATGELDPFTKKVLLTWEHKVNPHLVVRSASMPTNMSSTHSSQRPASLLLRTRHNTEIPIKRNTETEIVPKKRKSTIKIDQFANFVRNSKEKSGHISPVSKRQRLLDNEQINGQPTISKFFSQKIEKIAPTPVLKTEIDIKPLEFTASSSDVEDITEDDIDEVNQRLSEKINNSNDILSNIGQDSDIILSDEDNPTTMHVPLLRTSTVGECDRSRRISTSESEFDDNINSSEISESTITGADRTISRNTPFTLLKTESSMSLSTEPGDLNTECFLDEDSSSRESTQLNLNALVEGDNLIDKSNLLAEIYSFKPMNRSSTPVVEKENAKMNRTLFAPDKWMSNLHRNSNGSNMIGNSTVHTMRHSNQVHRPSPLQQRVPLQDVKINVNVNKNRSNNNNKNNKTNATTSGGPTPLSAFRYQSE